MSFIFNLFTFCTFLFLTIDTFTYQGFSVKHFFIDPRVLLLFYIPILLTLAIKNKNYLSKKFLKINNKYIFPVSSLFYLIFATLEKYTYANFVFSHFHLNHYVLIYLPILSGIIFYTTFPKFKNKNQRTFYLASPLILIFFYFLYIFSLKYYNLAIIEDGVVEDLQFFFYLAASIYFFRLRKRSKIFILFSIGLFFIAGEEISWGQRLLGIATPEKIKELNYQGEINLHNLKSIQKNLLHLVYMLIGLYGAFLQIILRKLTNTKNKLLVFTPPLFTFFCFFAVFGSYFLFEFLQFYLGMSSSVYSTIFLSQEIGELYLSLGFLAYAIFISRHQDN